MNQAKMTFYNSTLIQDLKALQQLADKTTHAMKEAEKRFSDPLDRAAVELDRDVELLIRNRDILLIREIREAISRLDHGTFGICESCGEQIGEKRLRVAPTSRLCISCKAREEKGQKCQIRSLAFA